MSVVSDGSGALLAAQRYYPYGEVRWRAGTLPTDFTFTGQRLDAGTGLYLMGARWYDPRIGRWISADTLVPEPGNPQSLNRYAYANNSPLTYIDRDGHFAFVPLLIIGGIALLKAVDYGWTVYDAAQSLRVMNDPNASEAARAEAAANLALTAAFEAAEPDDLLPVALPLDDLARKGILKLGREAGQEAAEEATEWVGKEGAARTIKGFATPQKLSEHFKKHGAEFGFKSESEYLAAAQKFASSQPGSDVLVKIRANGDRVIYNVSTNEFAVVTPDGTIRTYFKPDPAKHGYPTNLDYFNAQ